MTKFKNLAYVGIMLYPVSRSVRLYKTASFHNCIKGTRTSENLCAGKTVVNKVCRLGKFS